jgi:hypothetical protein
LQNCQRHPQKLGFPYQNLAWSRIRKTGKPKMEEDRFNMSMRKFLKQVGVTSQRELERIIREQRPAKGPLRVKMVLTAEGTNLQHVVEDEIDLD